MTIEIPTPHVPFGPGGIPAHEADAEYLRSAARNIDGGYSVGGSNVTNTVIKLLHDAANAVEAGAVSSKHPLRDYIEQRVINQTALGVPIPKYQLVVSITGNSRKEISDRIRSLDVNWDYEYGDRDSIESTDGTTSILMEHTNPEQTPEAYDDELQAWSRSRRAERQSQGSNAVEPKA